jgi:hypothetical protein
MVGHRLGEYNAFFNTKDTKGTKVLRRERSEVYEVYEASKVSSSKFQGSGDRGIGQV